MFTQPMSSPPPVGPASTTTTTTTTNNPSSPSPRTSRLRGLSYLRTYTQNHLLSREHANHPQPSGSVSSTTAHPPTRSSGRPNNLTRSASYSPTSASIAHAIEAEDSGLNRLSLIASLQEPLIHPTAHQATPTGSTTRVEEQTLEDRLVDTPTTSGVQVQDTPDPDQIMTRARSSTTGEAAAVTAESLPSIRFSAYYDPRATRPSLTFPPVSRTLPSGGEVIRVGRYSERDSQPNIPINVPSAAPVGFKSKVVSRRHCEFWYDQGKWYIKDVKSSSGTFLNHIRLSPPGTESKPFAVNDGDIVQLGIDFKGGEEMIFRCVKMRLELNRGWQNKLNAFNMTTHKRLRTMASANSPNSYSQDCSICLNSIAPCQCLFVAPCSHTWHFKCIRSLLSSPQYPIFICPNCRAAADLEADIEDPAEDWEQLDSDEAEKLEGKIEPESSNVSPPTSIAEPPPPAETNEDPDTADVTVAVEQPRAIATPVRPSIHSTTEPVPIPTATSTPQTNSARDTRTPSPMSNPLILSSNEGPITPRNDAGPWVFDGSAGRRAAAATANMGGMRSLDAATEMEVDV